MTRLLLPCCLFLITDVSGQSTTFTSANSFYSPSPLPFQAPRFDKITNADFKPAIEEGVRQQLEEIKKIADNPAAPTFANTFVEIEKSGQLLTRVYSVFNALNSANTNPDLEKIDQETAAQIASTNDALFLNTALFAKVQKIYQQRDQLSLDPESKRLVEYYFQKFVIAGARLAEAEKEKLKKLNEEEATLQAKFSSQLLGGTKASALALKNKADLAGLTDAEIETFAQNAKNDKLDGQWEITLQNTTQQPLLQSLSSRTTRQQLFEKSWLRCERNDAFDTRASIARIAQIRAQKAKLIGFGNYAEWQLQDQMAKTPAAVESFLAKLTPAAIARANREAEDIQALIDSQKGGFKAEAYDWNFYSDQIRKTRYQIDESQTKPYFEINNVLQNGVFYVANLLYGISFKERTDLPVYQKDVRVFDVLDKDGSQLALFYCDYFQRDNKAGGAWMSNMVGQSKLLGTKPVIYNVCNFPQAPAGEPQFITWSNMKTMFHEFGHALHGIFANQMYPSISGTSTARDFVEFPSQFNEHWASDPKVFSHFAVHYKTGELMPQALVDKLKKAATFNQGYAMVESLAAYNLDLQWHTLAADAPLQDVDQFEATALKKTKLDLKLVPPRYRSSYFKHIWSNGYAAGYYAYGWTEMLAHDAFAWFEENGGLTRENGQRFRDMILSRGNTIELGKMYKDFRGKDPDITPMLVFRGLK